MSNLLNRLTGDPEASMAAVLMTLPATEAEQQGFFINLLSSIDDWEAYLENPNLGKHYLKVLREKRTGDPVKMFVADAFESLLADPEAGLAKIKALRALGLRTFEAQ